MNYKKAADLILKQKLDNSFIQQIKCKSFYVKTSDSSSSSYSSFEDSKYERQSVKTITFTYSFFSKSIMSVFSFDITLNSNKRLVDSESTISSVPFCIEKGLSCDFISKDSATQIAVKDSISYQNNLEITFEVAPKVAEFYWVIKGHPKPKPQHRVATSSYGEPTALKYIDAKTGKIVSRNFFFRKL